MDLIKTIVLITSGQPSANPRLVKEATALCKAGYDVKAIYVPISLWADKFDEQLFLNYPSIQFIKTGYHPQQSSLSYKYARVRRKILSVLSNHVGDKINLVDYSTILFGQELLKEAKKHKADLYIAHNLGALPVAVKVAKMYGAKVGFDAEDFHRGEFADNSPEKFATKRIEDKYFKELNYLTVASPLIGQVYSELFPNLSPVVINNVFKLDANLNNKPIVGKTDKLRIFWFSQFVGKNRGLETAIKALGELKHLPIQLSLLGSITPALKDYFLQVASEASRTNVSIHFIKPVQEDEIFRIAASHDIGLGAEVAYCENRDVCLTNKIFTYLLSGLALVLSDTKSQKLFLKENKDVGLLYESNNYKSLAVALETYYNDRTLLKSHKENALKLAETKYNWDLEKYKFLKLVEATLAS